VASRDGSGACRIPHPLPLRQLLAYAGQESSSFELVDLSRLVGEMLPLLAVSISKHAVLKTELAENLPAVWANVHQLRRILMNLVTNASEALAGDGE
jgi:signal transduction histidine kinase